MRDSSPRKAHLQDRPEAGIWRAATILSMRATVPGLLAEPLPSFWECVWSAGTY